MSSPGQVQSQPPEAPPSEPHPPERQPREPQPPEVEADGADGVAEADADEAGRQNTIEVRIAGKSYTMRSAVDAEHMERCAAIVNERIERVATPGMTEGRNAILAALTLAHDLLAERTGARARIQALTELVQRELGEPQAGEEHR